MPGGSCRTLQVGGVSVSFPVQPYPCQISLASKLIKALTNKHNALLESPTGSGKTLVNAHNAAPTYPTHTPLGETAPCPRPLNLPAQTQVLLCSSLAWQTSVKEELTKRKRAALQLRREEGSLRGKGSRGKGPPPRRRPLPGPDDDDDFEDDTVVNKRGGGGLYFG